MFPTVIDNTMRAAMAACMQKFYLQFVEDYTFGVPSVDLHAGASFARGLEVVRKAFYEDNTPADDSVAMGVHALLEAYGDFVPVKETNKTALRMAEGLVEYFAHYPLETDPVRPHFRGGHACIEFSFSLPLPINHPDTNEPLIYCGRTDMIAEFQNALWIEDDKTTSQLGASWAKQWELNSQFLGYCWAAREFGYPVAGFIVRGMSILKGGFGHESVIRSRPDYLINRWYEQLLRDITRAKEQYKRGFWDYDFGGACGSYGGCLFQEACGALHPQRVLDVSFIKRKWDPLTRVEVIQRKE